MSDIVERIRSLRYVHVPQASQLFEEACVEIERLRAITQGGDSENDIVTILRDISHDENVEDDIRKACLDGAREITAQRGCTSAGRAEIARLRLTDAEREAVRFFSLIDGPGNVPVANKRAATLRGLLERLK